MVSTATCEAIISRSRGNVAGFTSYGKVDGIGVGDGIRWMLTWEMTTQSNMVVGWRILEDLVDGYGNVIADSQIAQGWPRCPLPSSSGKLQSMVVE